MWCEGIDVDCLGLGSVGCGGDGGGWIDPEKVYADVLEAVDQSEG